MIISTSRFQNHRDGILLLVLFGLLFVPSVPPHSTHVILSEQSIGQTSQLDPITKSGKVSERQFKSDTFLHVERGLATEFAWNATLTVEVSKFSLNATALQFSLTLISLIDHLYLEFTQPAYNFMVTNTSGATIWCYCPPQVTIANQSFPTGMMLTSTSTFFFYSPSVINLGPESITIFETGMYEFVVYSTINNWEQPIHRLNLTITLTEQLLINPTPIVTKKTVISPGLDLSAGNTDSFVTGSGATTISTSGSELLDNFIFNMISKLLLSFPAMAIYVIVTSGGAFLFFAYRRQKFLIRRQETKNRSPKDKDNFVPHSPHPDVLTNVHELVTSLHERDKEHL